MLEGLNGALNETRRGGHPWVESPMKRSFLAAPRAALFLVFSLFLLLSMVGLPGRAAAQPPAAPVPATSPSPPATATVYVVEIATDRLDAERLRAAIGRELGVTAVSPDDARASVASARLRVETKPGAKSLTVTFTKAEPPVTRTVDLPDDAQAAERAAVFLVGNVARDEAREVLGGLARGKPASESDSRNAAPPVDPDAARAAEDVARLRAFFKLHAAEATRSAKSFRTGAYILSGALIAAGTTIMVVAKPDETSTSATPNETATPRLIRRENPWTSIGGGVLGAGGGLLGAAFFLSVVKIETAEEPLLRRLGELEYERSDVDALRKLEQEWYEKALEARRSRHVAGVLGLTLGGLGLGGSILGAGLDADWDHASTFTMVAGFSVAFAVAGVAAFAIESPMEQSYRTWHALRGVGQRPAPTPRPTFGAAPLPGGGMISMGLTF